MSNWQRWSGIMKAYPFEEKRLAKWEPPYIVQPKYDGVRCRAVPISSGYLLLSSEENVIFSVPHINDYLVKTGYKLELDGELYCHGKSFEEIVSITSRTVNLHSDRECIGFHIFDIVDETTAQAGRLKDLTRLSLSNIAPFWLCNSLDDIMRTYDNILSQGYEGIIVRNLYAPYVRKRSTWVMKFKPKKEDIYEIVDYNREISIEGTPKESLGSLQCKSGDGNTFAVGSGFTRDTRDGLWRDRESLSGKFVKVQYQHLTSGKKVPRFPIFMEVIESG